jgi:hypothetical protein
VVRMSTKRKAALMWMNGFSMMGVMIEIESLSVSL